MPKGSPTVATSGGSAQPVSQGESARAIHPEGAITNAMPIASAECGVARTGASHAPARRNHGRSCAHAQKPNASATEAKVAPSPDTSVTRRLVPNPGKATSSRHGVAESASPPIAGR